MLKAVSARPIEMPSFKKLLPCLVVLLVLISSSHAIDRAHYTELSQKLGELAKQKDWQGARAVLSRDWPSELASAYAALFADGSIHRGASGTRGRSAPMDGEVRGHGT